GGAADIVSMPIPLNCQDGFNEAYYGRPERLLDPEVRSACSAWSFVDRAVIDSFEAHLRRDLAAGTWDATYGHFRTQPEFVGSLLQAFAGERGVRFERADHAADGGAQFGGLPIPFPDLMQPIDCALGQQQSESLDVKRQLVGCRPPQVESGLDIEHDVGQPAL